MFEALRKFITDISSATGPGSEFADDDYRLATAALLVHIANVDGKIDPPEKTRLRQIIEDRFGLDPAATGRLIEKAEESDREAVDFFHFTNVLKRSLDDDGRHKIIEMMWDVVLADGVVSEFEENVVWRIAELLGVSNRDRIMLRHKIEDEPQAASGSELPLPADTDAGVAGPWSSPAAPASAAPIPEASGSDPSPTKPAGPAKP